MISAFDNYATDREDGERDEEKIVESYNKSRF